MSFDSNNPVVKLCVEGMNAEAEGNTSAAHRLFQLAWDTATNDFEAFTAAHYLARNQSDPQENLRWNLVALNRAGGIEEEVVKQSYPSLLLNVAKSYENLGNQAEAHHYYQSAAENSQQLPNGKYSDMIKFGISEGLKRTTSTYSMDDSLTQLIHSWCDRRALKPLALVLPAYLGNLGTENDTNKLISALSYLSATKYLPTEEQEVVEQLIAAYATVSD